MTILRLFSLKLIRASAEFSYRKVVGYRDIFPLWRDFSSRRNVLLRIPECKLVGASIFYLFLILSLAILLYWRFQLGIIRYFDADEFAHLHWGYNFFIGKAPYRDFFYLFPPFFLIPVSLLFHFYSRSVTVLIGARIAMFGIFFLSSIILFFISQKLRNRTTAFLTLIIFSFLPIPYDKMLEVRPDLLATMLSLMGMYFLIIAEEKRQKSWLFFSGFFYSLSVCVLPKTLFYLLPLFIYITFRLYQFSLKKNLQAFYQRYVFLVLGLLIPVLVVIIMLFNFQSLKFGLYSMTKISAAVTKTLGSKFYMHTNLFFYPNDTYYGFPRINQVLLVNLFIYIVSFVWGIGKFIASLSHRDENKCLQEFIVSFSFMVNIYAFMKIVPLRHAQYLIILAPLVAFYFADFLWSSVHAIQNVLMRPRLKKTILSYFLTFAFVCYLLFLSYQVFQIKKNWTNKPVLAKIDNFLNTFPQQTAIFDLSGETIFFPDGYYFCCLPYGQYEEALLFKLPDIEKEMEKRKTRFVHSGSIGRLNVIPALQSRFIRENFQNYYPDGSVLIKKN